MDNIWAVVLVLAIAVPVFLLVRWLAARRGVELARRRRGEQGRPRR